MNIPKTPGQSLYVSTLKSAKPIIVSTGPAGCGKTMFACQVAAQNVHDYVHQRIVLTRPIVATDEDMGYLPGDIDKKMEPWTKPMFEIFQNYFTMNKMDKVIEIEPLGYMRGRTFNNTFIIADEMQNSTKNQMKMILTRLGENSKLVVTGDLEQSDLDPYNNGLFDLVTRLNGKELEYLDHVILENDDIQRHPAVSEVLDLYI